MKRTIAGAVLVFGLAGGGYQAYAQAEPGQVEVTHDVKHDVSPPLRILPIIREPQIREAEPARLRLAHVPPRPDPVIQSLTTVPLAATSGISFAGIGQGAYGFTVNSAPPDTNGSVGATQYVQWVNTSFAVFDKSGNLLLGPTAGNTLWSGFGGGCQTNNDGDIVVLWDKAAQRWFLSQFSVSSTPYLQCVAISTSSDATGTWYRYAFQQNNFDDYPKTGVWPDAYYQSFNMFNGNTFAGGRVCAFQRSAMLTGAAATQQCFQLSTSYFGLLPSDLDGATAPPTGSPNFFLMFDSGGAALDLWKFHVDWTTPANSTFSGPSSIAVAAFNPACSGGGTCIPQPSTTQQLDSLADRLMYRLAYRNFGDHESLVVNHSVTAGTGVGLRWYEIRSPNATPAVFQQGTFAPDSGFRWMGSIAMDKAGDLGLGYSVSSSSVHPTIRYTGRIPTDTLGTLETESTLISGGGSQSGQSLSRWGDYSSMSVDPADDCTFWYTQEYIQTTGAFNWSTQVGTFKFANCTSGGTPDFTVAASPTSVSVTQGSSGQSTISTTVSGGFNSAIGLSASGLPAGATAGISPPSIAAPGSGSSTLTIAVGAATATGTYPVTVTGTGGGVTHTATVSLTVNPSAAPNFSISAAPTALTVTQGSAGTSSITTAVSGGFNSAIALSASGMPSGTTAGFNPASVAAPGSGSSVMTLTVGASTAVGTYTVTVTGTGGGLTHAATVLLTVGSSGGGPTQLIADGGFEAATVSGLNAPGWTATTNISGRTVITYHGSYPHAGTNYAFEGSSNNENDTLTQTVAIPANTTSAALTFWVNVVTQEAPGTAYDFLKVEIHNSSGTLLATPLTLSNLNSTSDGNTAGTYFQPASVDLSAYAGQTVQVVFHATTDVSLPTTFRIDDVSLLATGASSPNFSILASPASVSLSQGSSGNSTIATAVSGGFNSAIALSASGLPAGATAAFNPISIAAPGSGTSVMTIATAASTPTGTYSITVAGSGGGLTNTATISLTVTTAGGSTQLIVDGGFESATSSGLSAPGWTATSNISSRNVIAYHGSYPHAGTNYAFEGSSNNENDTLTQTLAIPANASSATLTFWINIVTNETSSTAYDFLKVEIHNSSGTLLATPLTLSNLNASSSSNTNGVYFQPSAVNLTAYAGQTIQLVFHGTTDVSLTTTFRIDDVSVIAVTP